MKKEILFKSDLIVLWELLTGIDSSLMHMSHISPFITQITRLLRYLWAPLGFECERALPGVERGGFTLKKYGPKIKSAEK